MANNNQLLPVCVVYSLHTVEKQLGTFSSLNSLGTCVQDMKSCPTPAVESSKIPNGFDKAGFWFQTCQPSLFHTCSDHPDRYSNLFLNAYINRYVHCEYLKMV